ncbi:hypothetical protein EIN_016340 [Entamoeba invadens IP1]|uniref:hypothetical protein n=1 Tax=Entamoeba invadens IP1 TaxID=370355 RepID=UPI0002C3DBB7|nr:hypothetical protein EIN_016340 [Entamoeba invadens IP1]ELP90415.1 hypothetical protein EIN_016340 [Entamoeba invadens IP1]|eukprot:XP_004257186.1 hypothetical protein EIN_016340 [Entamoeba invadens IP1]
MNIVYVFIVCFIVVLGAIMVLPLYPMFEKAPQMVLYPSQMNYKKYEGKSSYNLLCAKKYPDTLKTESFTVKLEILDGKYSLSGIVGANEVSDPSFGEIELVDILNFKDKTYALEKKNGIVFEMLNTQKDNEEVPKYTGLIPRLIIPANKTNEVNTMKFENGFVKDDIFHIVAENGIVAAFDGEYRMRWGEWATVFKTALNPLNCEKVQMGNVVYSRSNFTFGFFPFSCCVSGADEEYGCDKMVLTDMEYNLIEMVKLPVQKNQRIQSARLIPFKEDNFVLLVKSKETLDSYFAVMNRKGEVLMQLTQVGNNVIGFDFI